MFFIKQIDQDLWQLLSDIFNMEQQALFLFVYVVQDQEQTYKALEGSHANSISLSRVKYKGVTGTNKGEESSPR